jgi:hypothetical protein
MVCLCNLHISSMTYTFGSSSSWELRLTSSHPVGIVVLQATGFGHLANTPPWIRDRHTARHRLGTMSAGSERDELLRSAQFSFNSTETALATDWLCLRKLGRTRLGTVSEQDAADRAFADRGRPRYGTARRILTCLRRDSSASSTLGQIADSCGSELMMISFTF